MHAHRQTLSSMNTQIKREHSDLMTKVAEHRAGLHQVQKTVDNIEGRMEGIETARHDEFKAVSSKAEETQSSLTSLRNLGEQIMSFIRTFPQEIRDLLQSIVQSDWRTYQAVLQIQDRLARAPSSLHDFNIRFVNALGEYRELPYEHFCHWEVCTPLPVALLIPSISDCLR